MRAHLTTTPAVVVLLLLSQPARADDARRVDGAGFVVTVSAPPHKAGARAEVAVVIEPAAGYKMNEEYPLALVAQAPADVAVAKAKLARADARRADAGGAAFAVAVTPRQAGTRALRFDLKFALCTATTCETRHESVPFTLTTR